MKKLLILFLVLFFISGCIQETNDANVLTIYTYDSMVSDWGLGPIIIPKFEEQCNCKVEMIAAGDAGQLVNRLILEKDNPKADVVIGIDNTFAQKAIKYDILEKFVPNNIENVPEELRFDKEGYLTPYDYGYIAFVYNSEKVNEPKNFEDLLKPEYKDKIIIEDPRTSSPGLSLLLWTVAEFGDPEYIEYWKKLKPNILTVTPGWDMAYGLFQAGEADVVLSYATSPAYHAEYEQDYKYKAADFKKFYRQIEASGIVKGTDNRKLAEEFIEFTLTDDFQKEIPLTQWIFPINENIELPESYNYAVYAEDFYELDAETISEKQDEWISEWKKIFS